MTDFHSDSQIPLPAKGDDVASANDITLGVGNYFVITGTTTINTIAKADKVAGQTMITLEFRDVLIVSHNVSGSGESMLLAGSSDIATSVDDILLLQFDGVTFRESSRTLI